MPQSEEAGAVENTKRFLELRNESDAGGSVKAQDSDGRSTGSRSGEG